MVARIVKLGRSVPTRQSQTTNDASPQAKLAHLRGSGERSTQRISKRVNAPGDPHAVQIQEIYIIIDEQFRPTQVEVCGLTIVGILGEMDQKCESARRHVEALNP
jgi:hypothetical protein